MLAFTHRYTALPTPFSKLKTLDELRAKVLQEWEEVKNSDDYRQGDGDRRAFLEKLTIERMTSFPIGFRLQRDTSWLVEGKTTGAVFVFRDGGYPSRYFCRGGLVLPQLQAGAMTDVSDCVHPANLPDPTDWVYIEEWDQS